MASNILNSLRYIVVSGASKGLNYLVLLYFAVGIFSEQYVTILLLLSLEQLLNLLLPLNNPSIIYSEKIKEYYSITNKLISSSLLILVIYTLLFLILKEQIFEYYSTENLIVYFSILFNVFINGYLFYLTNYYKLIQEHNKALQVQALYFISFLSIIVFTFFLENKVMSFFFGKSVGFLIIIFLIKILKFNITKFHFLILDSEEFKKMLNLFSVSILGWISGLGFINLAKIYCSPEVVVRVGYILNLWNIFLLIGIGVNSVYHPIIKKYLVNDQVEKAKNSMYRTLLIYFLIAIVIYLVFVFINTMGFLENSTKIKNIFLEIPYTLILFIISVFYYVIHPFYLVKDKFKTFNFLVIIAFVFSGFTIATGVYIGYNNFVAYLIIMYFFKSSFLYVYGKKKLIKNV